MNLVELTGKLQGLCHDGHSLAEVECGTVKDGGTIFYDVDSVTVGIGGQVVIGIKEQKDNSEELLMKVLNAIPKVENGEALNIECPLCGDKHNHERNMTVGRTDSNGHLWVNCRDCGFVMGA